MRTEKNQGMPDFKKVLRPVFSAGGARRPWAALLGAWLMLAPTAAAAASPESVIREVHHFAGLGTRLPGYPGNPAAAAYIEDRFRALGLKPVTRETYPVVSPVEDEPSRLVFRGRDISLRALWPNHVRTSMVPREGITGPLVYGRAGDPASYRGAPVPGSIMMFDFNCGARWMEAGLLGARALLFIEPDETTFYEARRKFLDLPVDLPRFYISRADADYLLNEAAPGAAPVTVFSRQAWRKVEAANILGYLPGTDPDLEKQLIVFTAYYDSISVVPGLAPGADQASGIAVMLSLAEHFAQSPPRWPLLFVAKGSHFQSLRGMDDFINRHYRKLRPHEAAVSDPLNIRLMVNLELSSHSDQIAIWHNSVDLRVQRFFAPYARQLLSYVPPAFQGRLLNGVSPERGMSFTAFLPEKIRTGGTLAIKAALPVLSFVTVYDGRLYFDTPLDTPERVNAKYLGEQFTMLRQIFDRALNDPKFIQTDVTDLRDTVHTLNGRIVSFDPKAGFVPNLPVVNAVVSPRYYDLNLYSSLQNRKSCFGVRGAQIELTDEDGRFSVSQMSRTGGPVRPVTLEAFTLDGDTGAIVMAPDLGVNGAQNYPVLLTMDTPVKDWMIVLFNCESTNVYDLVDPRYLVQLDRLTMFDASNSIPTAYGLTYYDTYYWQWSSDHEPLAVLHTPPGMKVKLAGETGPLGKRLLLINSAGSETKEMAEGEGYLPAADRESFLFTPFRAARDMINLNEYRIANFAQFGIVNERLSALHQSARDWLEEAGRARSEGDWFAFLTNSRRSVGLESRAYPDVRATTNDVIIGLIFYFVILLPFAFFFERLVFGFSDIRKQIAAVFLVFLAVYTALRFVHPGFKLSQSPEVILLGFIVLTLSAIVIFLMAGKFEQQMQQLKKERGRMYDTDVGRLAASGTAFSLGMANMKRRKLRTALTAVTLILLTFTVLSFTSIKSFMRFNQVRRPYDPSYEGLLIRDPAWAPIEEASYSYVRNEFAGKGTVAPRAWFLNPTIEQSTFVRVRFNGREDYAFGLLGLSSHEKEVTGLDRMLSAGRWFAADDEHSVIISQAMAQSLGISPAMLGSAEVEIYGEAVRVIGLISDGQFNDFRDLDGERMTPVNFSMMPDREMTKMRMERTARVMGAEASVAGFTQLEAANVAIVPFEFLRRRGGTIQSIAVRFDSGHDIQQEIEDFVSRLAVNIFAGIGNRTFVFSSLGLTSFAGMGNLFIPILIASLIVLNTMLGAVYERVREIAIYSSVGLAPSHISALFFAEACVYAVIGAVAGYLLGQVVTRVLSAADMLSGLTLNYSSLSAVTATMIVMVTVFLSTIFPAKKASELSVPDVTRRWVLPKPAGDDWRFDFPFTVGASEVLGLMVFLRDYFDSYSIESVGSFYTADTKLSFGFAGGGGSYLVGTRVHLSPFDLGVRQALSLVAEPMGEFGFYLIRVQMQRESGEASDWQRLNRRFLDGIRKQFLVWRTIDPKVKEEFRSEGEKLHGKQG